MTTSQIIGLDYREEENKKIIKKVLCKIKPLAKYSTQDCEIPIEMLEKTIDVLCRKYEVMLQSISKTTEKNSVSWYTVNLYRTDTLEKLGVCYACCIYEALAKTTIKLYSDIKKLDIPIRNW